MDEPGKTSSAPFRYARSRILARRTYPRAQRRHKFYCQLPVSKLSDGSGGGWGGGDFATFPQARERSGKLQAKAAQLARANEDLLDFAYPRSRPHCAAAAVVSFLATADLKYRERMRKRIREVLTRIATAGARVDIMLRGPAAVCRGRRRRNAARDAGFAGDAIGYGLAKPEHRRRRTRAVITCDALPLVPGHAVRLTQVFQNLIGNALKYRRPGVPPEIHVSPGEAARNG